MLIGLYFFVANILLPRLGAVAKDALPIVLQIVIILSGIVLIFGAVGFKISTGLGSTVIGGLFKCLSSIGRALIRGIIWLVKSVFKLIPRVFSKSTELFAKTGPFISRTLATVVTVLIIIIII